MLTVVVNSPAELLRTDLLPHLHELSVSSQAELLEFRQDAVNRLRKIELDAIDQFVADWMRNVVEALELFPDLARVYRYELSSSLIPYLSVYVSIEETYLGKTVSNSLFRASMIRGEEFWYVTHNPIREGIGIMKFLQKVYRREGRL